MPICNDGALIRMKSFDREGRVAVVMRYYNSARQPLLSEVVTLEPGQVRSVDDRLRAENDYCSQLPTDDGE